MDNLLSKLKNLKLPIFSTLQVCFDLGTTVTRIAVEDRGIVLKEASCLGLNNKNHEYIFIGNEAKLVTGKVPEFIKIIKPIVSGIISDFDAEVALVSKFMEKSVTPYTANYKIFKPSLEIIAAVPSVATEIEQKAVEEVFHKIGASRVYILEKPLATALGCGFNVFAHKPVFIVDLGGGLIEMAVISGGGAVSHKAIKNAGEHMNKLIYNYIYLKHGIILGETTCEELKIQILSFKQDEKTMIVRGKSLETGLPKSAKIKTGDIKEALLTSINQVIDSVKEVVEMSPPEVVDEIYNHGIILAGGLSNIPGIDKFFSEELKIEVHVADMPENATIRGLMKIGKSKESLQHLRLNLP